MGRRERLSRGFGAAVKAARVRAKLTQERLAFSAGIHPVYLSQIERGDDKNPSLAVIDGLARGLHTKPHVLLEEAEKLVGG